MCPELHCTLQLLAFTSNCVDHVFQLYKITITVISMETDMYNACLQTSPMSFFSTYDFLETSRACDSMKLNANIVKPTENSQQN